MSQHIFVAQKPKNISWADFHETETVKRKIRQKIRGEMLILSGCKAVVRFERRDLWFKDEEEYQKGEGKEAAIYRIEFYNKEGYWVGNSYAAVYDNGTIDYDQLEM